MKRLICISLFIMFFFSSIAMAGDVSGQTFTVGDCTAVFVQGPFGGESGEVTVACPETTTMYQYIYSIPKLMVYADVDSTEIYEFVMGLDYNLWSLASGYYVLVKE